MKSKYKQTSDMAGWLCCVEHTLHQTLSFLNKIIACVVVGCCFFYYY